MMRFLQPLWLLLTTSKDSDLRQMIEYLKEENNILRSKLPERITVTARERNRLLKFGSKIGGAIREVISIVSYRTFCRWRADAEPSQGKKKATKRKPGRPRTKEEIRELILKLARENNGWGSTRVLGELKKLGITTVGRTTVAEIMREAGLDPGRPMQNESSSRTAALCRRFRRERSCAHITSGRQFLYDTAIREGSRSPCARRITPRSRQMELSSDRHRKIDRQAAARS